MNSKNKFVFVASVAVLAACTTAKIQPLRDQVASQTKVIEANLPRVSQQKAGEDSLQRVQKSDSVWIPSRRIATEKDAPAALPETFRKQFAVNRTFTSISEVAERISLLTGIPVSVAPDASQPLGVNGQPQTAGQMPQMPGQQGMLPPVPAAPGMMVSGIYGQQNQNSSIFSVSYNGALSGFLDAAAARYNVTWEYRDNKIEIFRYMTRSFTIQAVPGDITSTSKIDSSTAATSSGSSGSSASNANMSTSVDMSALSVWRGIEDSVRTMLSPGGKLVSTPSIGALVVTDTPRVVATVEKYLEHTNAHLSKQVAINVQVLSVNLTHSDDYGINWTSAYESIGSQFGMAFNTAVSPITGAASLALRVLQNGETLKNGATFANSTNQWQGSKAVMSALSQQGDVSVMTSATAMTLNNQMVPLQVGRQQAYLASSATTQVTNSGTTTTLTPGTITTGFSMNVLPHIQQDGKLLLQYAIDLSSLLNLASVSSGGSTIQTPEIETRKLLQRVALRSGETLVLSGFESSEHSAKSQGTGGADAVLAGGAIAGKKNRTVIVILVRPIVVDKI